MSKSTKLARLACADSHADREFARLVRQDLSFWRQSPRHRLARALRCKLRRVAFGLVWPVFVAVSVAIMAGVFFGIAQLIQYV